MSESLRERVAAAADKGSSSEERSKLRSREKALILKEQWDQHRGKNKFGVLKTERLTISAVEFREEGGSAWVDVWTGPRKKGKPQFRVVNPPILVHDKRGGVELNVSSITEHYREDPVKALIEILRGGGK